MPKDIRKILKENKQTVGLASGHRERFELKLSNEKKPVKRSFFLLKIAASILIVISIGYYVLQTKDQINAEDTEFKITNLGSVSPEMQQIENYYLTAINYEMASLEPTPESKEILDSYMEKLYLLTEQYKKLTNELASTGVNEKTINALITNLQLRLQLLLELKDSITDLKMKNNNQNEKITI